MKRDVTVSDLAKRTRTVQQLFAEIEQRPWTVETFVVELLAEAGTLADSVMITEGYRRLRKTQSQIDLEDDVCDILFVLFMIADHYDIDIGKSYVSMLEETVEKIRGQRNA